MTDVSIVIVSYNTRDVLRDCLASVGRSVGDLHIEILVVDNASSDGSSAMVAAEYPQVRLLCNDRNAGFAAANNMALRKASGRYHLLLNPDTRLAPDALRELLNFLDATPAAGFCGPRLLNADGTHQPSARRFPTTLSAAVSMLAWSRHYPKSRHTLDLHALHGDEATFAADWVTGACLLVRAAAIRDVGMLDEGFFMYFEETDWCRRLVAAGWTGWYVHSAKVVHLGGMSVAHDNAVRPFSGDHPVHWVASSRRYMRRHCGLAGTLTSEALQLSLYSLVWLRHRWRRSRRSRFKAQTAAAALRHMVATPRTRACGEARATG